MNAHVTNPRSLLGANLTGALRWEGHSLVPSALDAEVVFDTSRGIVYRQDRPLARFVFGDMLGPGDVEGSVIGKWLIRYAQGGHLPDGEGGACVTDARDVALAMITAAERGISGEFAVVGPFITFEDLADILAGAWQARTSVAIPELGITFRPVEETISDVIAWQKHGAGSLVA
jgi:nucleoside-diphosphate-sugar epimerase